MNVFRCICIRSRLLIGLQLSFCLSAAYPAALPELGGVTVLSGGTTTATFKGGASNNTGLLSSRFYGLEAVNVTAEITVQTEDIGQIGAIYILVNVPDFGFFYRDSFGNYIPFTAVEGLQASIVDKTLEAVETVFILNNMVFDSLGLDGLTFQFWVGYSLNSSPSHLHYHAIPITVNTDWAAYSSKADYSDNVTNVLSNFNNWPPSFNHASPNMIRDVGYALRMLAYVHDVEDSDVVILLNYIEWFNDHQGLATQSLADIHSLSDGMVDIGTMPSFYNISTQGFYAVNAYATAFQDLSTVEFFQSNLSTHFAVFSGLQTHFSDNPDMFALDGYWSAVRRGMDSLGHAVAATTVESDLAVLINSHHEVIDSIVSFSVSSTALWNYYQSWAVGDSLWTLAKIWNIADDTTRTKVDMAFKDIGDHYRDTFFDTDIQVQFRDWALSGIGREDECSTSFAGYCPGGTVNEILDILHICSSTIQVRAQTMSTEQLQSVCMTLLAQEAEFHTRLQTNDQPVADDNNDFLELVIFESDAAWQEYGTDFFNVATNNGGIYLEGDPSDTDNTARFIAYVATWLTDEFTVWNLEHEYSHYLDGRFDMYGAFNYFSGVVWWAEGLAEYMTWNDYSEFAFELATETTVDEWHTLAEIFAASYNGSASSLYYDWGYFAVRFLFEEHNSDFIAIAEALRMSNGQSVYDSLILTIANTYNSEFHTWLSAELAAQ